MRRFLSPGKENLERWRDCWPSSATGDESPSFVAPRGLCGTALDGGAVGSVGNFESILFAWKDNRFISVIGADSMRRCRSSSKAVIVRSRPKSAASHRFVKSVIPSSNAALRNFSNRLPCNCIVICCNAMTAIWSPSSKSLPKRSMPLRFSVSIAFGAWSILSINNFGGGGARFAARLTLILSMIVPPSL